MFTVATLVAETPTTLKAGEPKIVAPNLAVDELLLTKLKLAESEKLNHQKDVQTYWSEVQRLQKQLVADEEVIQSLTKGIYAKAGVTEDRYSIDRERLLLIKAPEKAEVKK
jgi:hypothetical protein